MLVNPEIYLEVMNILLQTDVWYDMEDNNPIISSASENIFDKLEKLRGELSDEVVDKLSYDIFNYFSAGTETALLYGIQVAASLNEIICNPNVYSQYMLENFMQVDKEA